ncbi:MAG: glycoside hydrolase family 3 N-terminal domain-containing protein [Cyclobacteriaceae bacterium]
MNYRLKIKQQRISLWKLCVLFLFLPFQLQAQRYAATKKLEIDQQMHWVDSVYQSLTVDQRLGQLFMVAAYSNRDEAHHQSIDRLVSKYGVGGLIFFQGGPLRQARLTNRYQRLAKVPLFMAMDAEWGLGMRLDSAMNFPKQMTLGAIQDNQLIYDMGKEIANQCKRIGMQINFAPVIDINVNRKNPVIGYRSFGENKYLVTEKARAYMKGMQHQKVLANAKHFPGHGDTDSDSHYSLPVIKHSVERLDSLELYPFKQLIKDSLMSMMIAHLHIPALDKGKHTPSTLSKKIVTDLLIKKLGFEGLIFTDAMNMHGVTKYFKAGQANSKALEAGNDVLLFPSEVPKAIESLKSSIRKENILEQDITYRVKKILKAKYWASLHQLKPVVLDSLYEDLNNPKAHALNYKLYEKALTVVKNENALLPIERLDTNSFAVVSIGEKKGNDFQQLLNRYVGFDFYELDKKASNYVSLLAKLSKYKIVVVGYHNMSNRPSRKFGVTPESVAFLTQLSKKTNVITSVFGNAYSLKYFSKQEQLICAFEDNNYTRALVPQLIFGAIGADARLPISINNEIRNGAGYTLKSLARLKYGLPEQVGINSQKLNPIDTIVNWAIRDTMTPGCQVLVAKDGNVIFDKSYGFQTYEKKKPVDYATIYDLASITKVVGTTPSIMKLFESGKLKLDKHLSHYLKESKKSNKAKIRIRRMFTHQAGLKPYIPFWYHTIHPDSLASVYYSKTKSDSYSVKVTDDLYALKSIEDSLIHWTLETELRETNDTNKLFPYSYKYSDLGYHLMKRVVEQSMDESIPDFMNTNFYERLGMSSTSYIPLEKGYDKSTIAPTELDESYRMQEVRGVVNDQVAAMIGGVGGHAGLFSTTNDLVKYLQMMLDKGRYAEHRFLSPYTVNLFTQKQNKYCRRGLCWDKVQLKGLGPSSEMSSLSSYGHSGFTGTLIWVDPDYNLIYIFLSNRTYPKAANYKLLKNDIRTRIQDVVYEALLKE